MFILKKYYILILCLLFVGSNAISAAELDTVSSLFNDGANSVQILSASQLEATDGEFWGWVLRFINWFSVPAY